MFKRTRRTIAAIGATLALGTGSAVWAATSASAAPSVIPPVCSTGNLAVWVSYDAVQGAAGTWGYPLEFTNISNHACRTFGYPGVSATSAAGKQLGDAAARDPLFQPSWVNIAPGGTAHALLLYGAAEVATSGCQPTTASLLKVYPPNQFSARHGFFDLRACTLTHHVYLRVTVIRPGTNI